MPRAIKLRPENFEYISDETGLSIESLEEMLDYRIDYGETFIVLDYPASNGKTVPWIDLSEFFIRDYYEFLEPEAEDEFVPIDRRRY